MADRPTSLIAAIGLGCVGVFAIMGAPILVEVMVGRSGIDAGTAGRITALEALGTALGPVLALFWMQRLPWRLAAAAALLVVIGGNLLSASGLTANALLAVRFLVGLLGEGPAFALAMAIVGGTTQKDRNFAFLIAAQVMLGVLFFLALPMPRDAGLSGVMVPLAGLALIVLATTVWIPQPAASGGHGVTAASGASATPAVAALVVMLIWCTGLGAVWAFIKLIGKDAGLEEVAVGQALGLSTGVAVVGALAAAALADRFGRVLPVTIALAMQFAMVLLLRGEMSWAQFAITAMTFQIFWNLTGPYMMGTVALNDATGKVSLLIPTAQIGGFFLGPTLVSLFIKDDGLGAVNVVSAVCFVIAMALFIPLANRIKGIKGTGGH